jgi:energy-coupling factor transporter ATP-binding protein EcfA2
MSGGEKQRVAIARALAKKPKLIFADEPTSALDGENGNVVMTLLRKCAKEQGATVLCVTHDARLATFADRIITIEDGRITSTNADPAHLRAPPLRERTTVMNRLPIWLIAAASLLVLWCLRRSPSGRPRRRRPGRTWSQGIDPKSDQHALRCDLGRQGRYRGRSWSMSRRARPAS